MEHADVFQTAMVNSAETMAVAVFVANVRQVQIAKPGYAIAQQTALKNSVETTAVVDPAVHVPILKHA